MVAEAASALTAALLQLRILRLQFRIFRPECSIILFKFCDAFLKLENTFRRRRIGGDATQQLRRRRVIFCYINS